MVKNWVSQLYYSLGVPNRKSTHQAVEPTRRRWTYSPFRNIEVLLNMMNRRHCVLQLAKKRKIHITKQSTLSLLLFSTASDDRHAHSTTPPFGVSIPWDLFYFITNTPAVGLQLLQVYNVYEVFTICHRDGDTMRRERHGERPSSSLVGR